MPGRHILEGVVVLHAITHEFHQKKIVGVLFKRIMIKLNDPFYNKYFAWRVLIRFGAIGSKTLCKEVAWRYM
jgi:hypothetical protein